MNVEQIDSPKFKIEITGEEAKYLDIALAHRLRMIESNVKANANEYTFIKDLLNSIK